MSNPNDKEHPEMERIEKVLDLPNEEIQVENISEEDEEGKTEIVEEETGYVTINHLDRYSMMIVEKYANTAKDLVNIEKTCKGYRGIIEQFKYNPVPLKNEKEEGIFHTETYHFYDDPEIDQVKRILIKPGVKKVIIHEDDDKVDDKKYNEIRKNDKVKFEVNKTGKFKFNMDPSITVLTGVDDNILEDEANSEVKEIVIPYHITKIRENCFSCGMAEEEQIYGRNFYEGLRDIFIPNTVKVICPRAFFDCSIRSVNIPSSITFIPEGCFAMCVKLKSIHLPNTIKFLGDEAFEGCPSLKSITLPSSVTSLGNNCFKECRYLSNVVITSKLVSIGNECFAHDNIKHFYSVDQDLTPYSVDLPSTLTRLGNNIFYDCNQIKSARCDIPVIPYSCFCRCNGIRTVRLSYRVTEIGACAFYMCVNLKSINLPSSLKKIGRSTFQDCRELSSLHIPSTLTYLGEHCFRDCGLNPINLPSNLKGVIDEDYIQDIKNKIRWVPPDGSDIQIEKEKKSPQ